MAYRSESAKQVANKIIFLMGRVEQLCEQHDLRAPVGVELTDANGALWTFDYDPNVSEMQVPFVAPAMPITIRIEDCNGQIVEQESAEWAVDPEWQRNFVQ
jgi:YbbR domain-containing protein